MSQSREALSLSNSEKLIDWAFQTLISWSVIWLTCFVGLIELLPEIKLHSGFGIGLTVSLCLIYGILVIGIGYSSHRIGTLYAEIRMLQKSLPEQMKKKIYRAPHIALILDKEGKPRKKSILLLSIIISALWVLTLIFKILNSLN
jgi:hypothetical protein